MTNGRAPKQNRHFTLTWLPWLLGGGVLALYALTLNRNLSFLQDWAMVQQLPMGVRASGWYFGAEFLAPVYYAATYPLRWLPAQYIPIAVNLFSAGCAALALGQLARSVALLPHDRTRSQRERLSQRDGLLTIATAWLPPLLATLACALSLSVWEHGTNGTGEMLDLLMFAYIVRSLLEYHHDEQDRRLYRAAVVYGLAITNNPAMIAFFPLFVGALVWIRRLQFFKLRFLGRMALCGLAGLTFYLLLPTFGSLSAHHTATFWELLQANLYSQKTILATFPRGTLLLLSLTTLLPVLLFSIRWSSQFGDPSRVGVAITTIAFHICHLVILLACAWMILNPGFSPREIAATLPYPCNNLTFLTLYYLAALSIGYYSGYLLLVSRAVATRIGKPGNLEQLLQAVTTTGIALLLIAAPAILLHRNLPEIRLTNGALQSQFAADLATGLPDKGIIISDDPRRLWALQQRLIQQQQDKNYTFACTAWLNSPSYQKFLQRKYPQWLTPPLTDDKTAIPQGDLLKQLEDLGKTNQIAYLHPSFGYYFESFSAQPNGLGSLLTPFPKGELLPPPLSQEVLERNQKFWTAAENGIIAKLLPITIPPPDHVKLSGLKKFYQTIGLDPNPRNPEARLLGIYYSRSLVKWGVELQRAGNYEAAAATFALAQKLNARNVVAEINLAFNEKFRRGEPVGLEVDKKLDDIFGESRSWEQVLTINGPYDTPGLAYAQGYVFLQGNLIRQAAQYFDRTRVQAPNDVASRLWLGQIYLNRAMPDRTIAMAAEIRQIAGRIPQTYTNLGDLFTLEAAAYLAKNEDATAQQIVATNLAADPNNFTLISSACKAFADNGRYAQALELTERLIKLEPDNVPAWINRGCFLMEVPDYNRAIESFSHVLTLETNNYRAVLYRAIAQLRAEKYDAAIKDYETVQRQYPKEFTVDFGLGEIAYRRHETNTAIRYYESYLNNAPPNTPEAKAVTDRLNELKGIKPPATNTVAPPAPAK